MKTPMVMMDVNVVAVVVGVPRVRMPMTESLKCLPKQISGPPEKEDAPDHEKPDRAGKTLRMA